MLRRSSNSSAASVASTRSVEWERAADFMHDRPANPMARSLLDGRCQTRCSCQQTEPGENDPVSPGNEQLSTCSCIQSDSCINKPNAGDKSKNSEKRQVQHQRGDCTTNSPLSSFLQQIPPTTPPSTAATSVYAPRLAVSKNATRWPSVWARRVSRSSAMVVAVVLFRDQVEGCPSVQSTTALLVHAASRLDRDVQYTLA